MEPIARLKLLSVDRQISVKYPSTLVTLLAAFFLQQAAHAQYTPAHPGSCGMGFIYSSGVCVPRGGGGNAYQPPRPGSCGTGFTYSAGVCVPRGGGATNAYTPPRPGSCATGFLYSAGMCVARR